MASVYLEAYDRTRSDVTRELLIAGVVFVAAAGLGGYGLARAALSPVERLRREVASVSARDPAPGLQVPRTRDEIAALAATMNELLGRLQGALARQRALVADASHELRTPFAVLRGELELAGPARGAAGRNSRPRWSTPARRLPGWPGSPSSCCSWPAATRTGSSHAWNGRPSARCSPAARSTRPREPGRLASPSWWTCPPGSWPRSIRIVSARPWTTWFDNALRFAPAGTPVEITARADAPHLVIEVRDQGPGFPEEFLPHAFERFARPDTGRARSDGGSGLGLAIVSAVAQAHGGRAGVRNLPGGGAAVTLKLPGYPEPG